MGSSSTTLKEGAPANPRLVYIENLARNNNKPMVLDTPVIVDVNHGSLRYRYSPYTDEPLDKNKRTEKPFAGTDTVHKNHYFYHARVQNNVNDENDFRNLYVTKGPASSKQKFVYYVYGKGLDAQDGEKLYPSTNKMIEKDYAWPVTRNQNHLYYCLKFPPQEAELHSSTTEEERLIADLDSTPDKSSILLQINENDTVSSIKTTLAVKLLKAASNLHIYNGNKELRNEDVIGDLRDANQEKFKVFNVQLLRM